MLQSTHRFGPLFAGEIRRRRVGRRNWSNWRWHLDEVFVRINGETHYLWRAVDHEGEVLEVFATKRRDRRAAHHGWAYVLPGCDDCDRQCGRPGRRSLAQQPGRELAPAVPTTGSGNGAVQRPQDPAEIRRRPCLDPQPLTWGIVSQGKDQFALRMVFLRGYGIQVRAPFGDTALRRAGQTHIRSPVAPAAPTSRFRRWRLRRTGPLFNTAISAKWLSGPSTWIRRG